MKNIHTLPTEKPSRFYSTAQTETKNRGYSFGEHYIPNTRNMFSNHNIHITNDEEIKEGDFFLGANNVVYKFTSDDVKNGFKPKGKKIILTTDQDLIKYGVQAIDDEFLEWFVKNPSCEKVGVEESNLLNTSRTYLEVEKYKIIIPKEETNGCIGSNGVSDPKLNEVQLNQPKQEPFIEYTNTNDCTSMIYNTKEEPKQETLEEALNRFKEEHTVLNLYPANVLQNIAELGAKWQQERMYSEEEVELIANEMVNWAIDNIGNPFPQSGKKFDEVIAKYKKQ